MDDSPPTRHLAVPYARDSSVSPDRLSESPGRNSSEERDSTLHVIDDRVKFKTQFLAALICCLSPISAGLVIGYTSPAIPDMKLPGRRIPLNDSAESWVGSFTPLGALCGGLIAGMAVDFLGRKACLIYTAVFYVFGWMFIIYAETVAPIYFGRFLTGVCVGVSCLNASVYLAEISSPQIRGILGSGFQLFINFGILLAYAIGGDIPWTYLAVVSTVFPILTMILMIPMPESPVWLVRQGWLKEANRSLEWLRGPSYDSNAEVADIQRQQRNEVTMSIKEFFRPNLVKPLLLMLGQMFCQQFCGINAIIFNALDIFKTAGSTINPNIQTVLIALVMVIASVVASFFIDRAGRRMLLLISAAVMAVSLFVLGGFYYLLESDKASAEKVSWLPMVCLMVFLAVFNIGFGPIPWLMMSELFPSQARGLASSLITASNWTMAFIITMTFKGLQSAIKPYGAFWLFGAISAGAVVFVWFCVPETKGKSLAEIQEYFSSRK